jgi:hypothetical protein
VSVVVHHLDRERLEVALATIPLNSTFDGTVAPSDLRITEVTRKDRKGREHTTYDLEVRCTRTGRAEPKWESAIAYPRHAAHSREIVDYHRIQTKLREIIEQGSPQ